MDNPIHINPTAPSPLAVDLYHLDPSLSKVKMEEGNECLKKSAESVTLGEIKKLDGSIQKTKQGCTSQGGYEEAAICLHNSFKSDGLRRMSSDEFERASDEGDDLQEADEHHHAHQEKQHKPVLATSEKTACYKEFEAYPVRVEGPEYS